MKRVLVTGATGHIGSEVVSQLRGTGCRIRAMSRHPRSSTVFDVTGAPARPFRDWAMDHGQRFRHTVVISDPAYDPQL